MCMNFITPTTGLLFYRQPPGRARKSGKVHNRWSTIRVLADYLIDIGPKAGIHGGRIVAQGTPKQVMKEKSIRYF